MITEFADHLVNYLIIKEVISGDNTDIKNYYKYGVEITLSSILNILVITILSLIFNSIVEGFLFLLVFIPTRQYVGGFHAKSYLRCNLTFGTSYLLTLLLCTVTERYFTLKLSLLILIAEILIISVICPIENQHKPIKDHKEYVKYKIIGCAYFIIWGALALLLSQVTFGYDNIVFNTLHLIVVLGILGRILERRRKHEKAEQNG